MQEKSEIHHEIYGEFEGQWKVEESLEDFFYALPPGAVLILSIPGGGALDEILSIIVANLLVKICPARTHHQFF
jgi:hypothetical protein